VLRVTLCDILVTCVIFGIVHLCLVLVGVVDEVFVAGHLRVGLFLIEGLE